MRKLKVKEISKITKIIKTLGIKNYKKELTKGIDLSIVEEITSNLMREEISDDRKKHLEKMLTFEAKSITNNMIVDIVLHIIEEYEAIEKQVFEFLASVNDTDVKIIEEKEIDWLIGNLKELYENALPDSLKTIIGKNINVDDVKEEIKKKMS